MSDAFDFVIVGGGSAGCVLANRLSADPRFTVCLLEAGPRDTDPWIHLPVGIPNVIANKQLDWMSWTTPQAGCEGRKIFLPRGKTLGGSSSINGMIVVRGHPSDYDAWAEAAGSDWSYASVLPFFRKTETFEGIGALGDGARFHGADGPLNISSPRYVNPIVRAFVEAARAAGVPPNDDFGGTDSEGAGLFHVFEKDGRRFSNADAYLHPVEHRANLRVDTGVLVEKIVIADGRAVGADVVDKRGPRHVRANAEVILAAGAIGSPQLLMLSGVGPGALSPKSRGSVRLTSPDPRAEPSIDPNYLADDDDLATTVAGLKLGRRILDQAPLAAMREREFEPGADVVTDDQLADFARREGATTYHPVGSCRMGSDDRPLLDAQLRVRGVDALRVIDASVMPSITGGNTNGPTTMIAEKGSAFLRAGHGLNG